MDEPKITWYAKLSSDTDFNKTNEIYAGTYTPDNSINVNLQIWNNRWGTVDVNSLTNFLINVYFADTEDNCLFDYCSIVLNNSDVLNIKKSGTVGVLEFPEAITLSGTQNDGTTVNNPDHYILLDFIFKIPDNVNVQLKENDLKSLFFEIIQL